MSIFGPPRPFAQTVVLNGPPEAVRQQLHMAASGVQGYTIVHTEPNSMLLQRRFIPTWAMIAAGIGFFFFFLGLLFLLARATEAIEIRVGPEAGSLGTRVGLSGVADSQMIAVLQGVLLGGSPVFSGQGGYMPGAWAGPQVTRSPDGRYWWDGLVWQEVSQLAPPTR